MDFFIYVIMGALVLAAVAAIGFLIVTFFLMVRDDIDSSNEMRKKRKQIDEDKKYSIHL
jgi:hypothetical protein